MIDVIYLDYTLPRPPHDECDPDYLAFAESWGKRHKLDGTGDADDWHECIARAMIARRLGMKIARPGTPEYDEVREDQPIWGMLDRMSPLRFAQERSVGRYILSPTFTRYCGRDIALLPADNDVMTAHLESLFNQGVQAVRIKDAYFSKTYMARVTSPEIPDDIGWGIVHRDGSPDAFMMYAEVDMAYEYRMFVVGGQVVCGAGCIEPNTPINNTSLFDPMMEKRRNDGIGHMRPDLVETYRVFAEQVAQEFSREGWVTYVMDVAMSNGRPLVIELNEIHNAGLFALDLDALADALAAHPETLALDANAIPRTVRS